MSSSVVADDLQSPFTQTIDIEMSKAAIKPVFTPVSTGNVSVEYVNTQNMIKAGGFLSSFSLTSLKNSKVFYALLIVVAVVLLLVVFWLLKKKLFKGKKNNKNNQE